MNSAGYTIKIKFKLDKKLCLSNLIFQTRFFKNQVQINLDCFLLFRIEVAIKEASSPLVRDEMLDEAKAMVRVSKHDHIVNIQGNFKVIDPKLYKRMLNPKEPGLLEKVFFSEK